MLLSFASVHGTKKMKMGEGEKEKYSTPAVKAKTREASREVAERGQRHPGGARGEERRGERRAAPNLALPQAQGKSLSTNKRQKQPLKGRLPLIPSYPMVSTNVNSSLLP